MAKEYMTVDNTIVLPYNWALGPTWTKFFDGLRQEKILGTKCKRCKKVLVPARTFCPYCFEDMDEWVEVSQRGTVGSWCLVNYEYYGQIKPPPYIIASIHLSGTDCNFNHFLGGIDLSDVDKARKKLRVGMRVRAVWSREKHGDIYDIAYFEPVR